MLNSYPSHMIIHLWERPSVCPSVRFQMTSPLKPLSQFCSNFIWSLLRLGERKIAKIVVVRWPRWPPCPYMVKTFKNLLHQNQGCLVAESLLKSSRNWKSTKVAKIMDVHWHLTFLQRGQVCFPMHLYGKNVEIYKWLLLWNLWASVVQISFGASLG